MLSDNGASQEGGPLGMVNAMGPYNFTPEPMPEKIARIDDIGGPDTHSNFPRGWAMASNTPLKRYKQNTHGGGIRDPLVMSWPKRICRPRASCAISSVHASDLAPTLLDVLGPRRADTIERHADDAARRRKFRGVALPIRPRRSRREAAIFRDVRPSRPLA